MIVILGTSLVVVVVVVVVELCARLVVVT